MRRVEFTYHTGFCGTDATEVVDFPDNVSLADLSDYASEGAYQNAASYGIYPYPEDENTLEESDVTYSYNIEGYWKFL